MAEQSRPRKYLQWLPLALLAATTISGDAVQAYQVEELQGKVETLEQVQVQQAITENEIKHIQKDMESLDDSVKDLDDKLDLILQRMGD